MFTHYIFEIIYLYHELLIGPCPFMNLCPICIFQLDVLLLGMHVKGMVQVYTKYLRTCS